MKPSKFHSNRDWHNWLVYKIGDKFLEKYSKYYGGRLVDLGCGEAPYKEYFLQYVEEYIGVDWTNTLHNSKANVASNLNEKIELPDEFADTLISLSVMEHLCEPQIFLNESYRILKRGRYMILQVPFMWWVHESPYDYFRYTPYGLKYLFEKSGFKVISIEPQAGIFTTLFLKFNYFTLRFTSIRFFGILIRLFLIPLWFLLQVLAPIFDKLDRNWELETCGYFVVAKKV
ncbi:MAG: class I SAM-dependent methyltransferase [Brevinematales bacterium]